MEEYSGSERPTQPGQEDERFILLRWADRGVQFVRGLWARFRERRASRLPRPPQPAPPEPGEEEIARWVALLARPEDPQHARALDELVVIGRPAVPMLIEALQGDAWIQPFRASEALGLIGDRRAIRHLKRLLNHPNSNVRWGAAEALGRIRSRWARGALHRAAREDENRTSWGETVAEAAQRAVASIDDTWISRIINVLQILFYMALCVLVIYGAVYMVNQLLQQRAEVTPTPTPTATATATATATPTTTPLPTFVPVAGTILGDVANVRDRPDSATGARIGVLHYGDEILIYGGRMDIEGTWWYLIRLARINNPATRSEVLEAGAYGWIHSSLVVGVTAPELAPTVAAVETMRALVATPTPLGSSLDLPTPTPWITGTVSP